MLAKPMFHAPRLSRLAAFLGSIGIEMRPGTVDVETLFPGSLLSRGSLIVDESRLLFPGDALHEAAHIALSPPERRSDDFAFIEGDMGGEELTAISWWTRANAAASRRSWAALLELDIDPEDIFHPTAYKGGDSAMIIDHARRGIYIGFPLLQVWEMAFDERNARLRGLEPFPHMVKWVRG